MEMGIEERTMENRLSELESSFSSLHQLIKTLTTDFHNHVRHCETSVPVAATNEIPRGQMLDPLPLSIEQARCENYDNINITVDECHDSGINGGTQDDPYGRVTDSEDEEAFGPVFIKPEPGGFAETETQVVEFSTFGEPTSDDEDGDVILQAVAIRGVVPVVDTSDFSSGTHNPVMTPRSISNVNVGDTQSSVEEKLSSRNTEPQIRKRLAENGVANDEVAMSQKRAKVADPSPSPVISVMTQNDRKLKIKTAIHEFITSTPLWKSKVYTKNRCGKVFINGVGSKDIMDLCQKIGPLTHHLILKCDDECIHGHKPKSWQMGKVFVCFKYLRALVIEKMNLRVDWTLNSYTDSECVLPSCLTHLQVGVHWDTSGERKHEFAQLLNRTSTELESLTFSNLQDFGFISSMMSNINLMKVDKLKELYFAPEDEDSSFLDWDGHQTLDMSSLFQNVFVNLKSFRPPSFYTNIMEQSARFQLSLRLVIENMPALTTLNLKTVIFDTHFSITNIEIPFLKHLTCHESAFQPDHVGQFETNFPMLNELVVWSNLTLLRVHQKILGAATFVWPDKCVNSFFNLRHQSLTDLKLSFNDKHQLQIPADFLQGFPSLQQLELHLGFTNYTCVLSYFLEAMILHPVPTLILSTYETCDAIFDVCVRFLCGVHPNNSTLTASNISKLFLIGNAQRTTIPLHWKESLVKLQALFVLKFTGFGEISNFNVVKEELNARNITLKQEKKQGFHSYLK